MFLNFYNVTGLLSGSRSKPRLSHAESTPANAGRTGTKIIFLFMLTVLALVPAIANAQQGSVLRLVLNTNNDGPGSLRQAISESNANPLDDYISFDRAVFGTTPQVISTSYPGYDITGNGKVTINGPGARLLNIVANNGTQNSRRTRLFSVLNGSTAVLDGLTISNGNTIEGGAIYNNSSTVILNNVSLTGNQATSGGAIYNATGIVTITNSTMSNNYASRGGAIASYGASVFGDITAVNITNATISNNIANTGGGIYNSSGAMNLVHVTIYGNLSQSAGSGGGGGIYANSTYGIKIRNSIIAGNSLASPGTYVTGPDISGSFASLGYNLIQNTSGAKISGNTTGDIYGLDPKLGPLANNGGGTNTHALLTGSAAINAADPNNSSNPTSDQRGLIRPYDGNKDGIALADIGAYEAQDNDGSPFDDDKDGIANAVDNCPQTANASQANFDKDASGDACDTDDDNDGVLDTNDAFPLNAQESVDTDRDGIGNNADPDDDNDGQTDANEIACNSNPFVAMIKATDTDLDNVPDCVDTDDDNDNVLDVYDAFPLNAQESVDTDNDGIGNNADPDDDNDGQTDANEIACNANPFVAMIKATDTDRDNVPDCVDTDDDNDGDPDATDCAPLNAAIGHNATEICNGIDDDCDGLTDEGGLLTLYQDSDQDGYGNADVSTQSCSAIAGYVSDNTDCNDNVVLYEDKDGDGYGSLVKVACGVVNSTDCNDSDATVYPGAVVCPAMASRPYNAAGTYSLDPLQTGNDCGIAEVLFSITGATTRSGSGTDASGSLNPGISTISWTVRRQDGSTTRCESTVTIGSPPVVNNAIRINAGGGSFNASNNRTFSADQYFGGTDRVSSSGNLEILNTTDDAIYRDERSSAAFNYSIPVQNGQFSVVLHFAEIWFGVPGKAAGAAGKRRFNVNLEGVRKLTDYDIYAKAGGALRAIQETFQVTVTDGLLNIEFLSGAANIPSISAIEVIPQTNANQAPVLAKIGNKTASTGQRLSFTAKATDPDAGQTRRFSVTGAPAGASMDPSSGVFSWTPAVAGTFKFTVAVADNGSPSLSDSEEITVIVSNPVANSPVRINAGGAAFTASGNRVFSADRYYGGTDRVSSIATGNILNTNDDELYRNERSSVAFNYKIPVRNGKMNVILHFAEIWFGAPGKPAGGAGKRRFNVNVEGARKLTNYDIYAKSGGALRAIQETFSVTVTDGILNLDFLSGSANQPSVSAIEVIPLNTAVRIASENESEVREATISESIVFPNPVTSKFTVLLAGAHTGKVSLQLVSLAGFAYELNALHKPEEVKIEADISSLSLASGIYVLKIQSATLSETVKVLVAE